MDDLVPECKKKLARFRIQELKDVLSHLGVPKTGRKQDLMDRILALLSDEGGTHGAQKNRLIRKDEVANIINETHKKMSHMLPNDTVTGGRSVSDSSITATKEETVDQKMRCPCGSPLKTEFMIQCADSHCQVLQHISCVIIPVESTEGAPPAQSQHYCEVCRIDRCDPFWKTLAHPLYPVKLLVSSTPDDGSQPIQTAETGFQITRANVHLLENSGYDVQAWCILLNDNVPFRMQWPQYSDLKVNGIPVKTINRPGSKMLGANGRDDGPSIAVFLVEGYNSISLSCSDARTFCVGVRLVKQRTVQQVISMIPAEQEGETFTEAVSRVCRCIGGGMDATNDDSDSDLEVIADNVTINLRCPMSGCRMKTAARFKGCIHLGCFDLHTLVEINQRSRKWQCPICLKNYSLEDIIIDPYLNRIVKMMQACDEDVTEIEVKSDGSWRVKTARPSKDLEKWHLSDGSLCALEANDGSNIEVSAVKSEHQLEHGNVNGLSNGHGNHIEEYSTNYAQEIISMSSGSSDDMQEDEFESVDHPCVMDYTPYNHNQTSGITNRSSSSSIGDPSIIVLSDSEEENFDTVTATGVAVPSPPNGSFSSLTANLETPDIHVRDAVAPDASSRPSGEAETSDISNNKQSGDPFTFPRQPRSVRRQHATKNVPGD
uniref:E3 SUMO-protein ligase SIZ1-like isoform X2 n=1 Tax=Erigeron canadensis TaxID=72917 RepID=UPI001CB98630|nr:E3 SUMO-protein ligase SIZ1-like isoform X2 [Erigeron canadensis]